MAVVGYIRVSTDKQDLEKQKYLLLKYAQKNSIQIDEFIDTETSSQKDKRLRRILELQEKLQPNDTLLVAELSRLGRNMLETLNIIHELSDSGVKIVFVRQPELSTSAAHGDLLRAIYSYFAQAEREYISLRTKQGLAAAKANGQRLGRPKGSKNKKGRVLDPFKEQIKEYLEMKIPINSIAKIINKQLEKPVSYNSYKYHIQHDSELLKVHRDFK